MLGGVNLQINELQLIILLLPEERVDHSLAAIAHLLNLVNCLHQLTEFHFLDHLLVHSPIHVCFVDAGLPIDVINDSFELLHVLLLLLIAATCHLCLFRLSRPLVLDD